MKQMETGRREFLTLVGAALASSVSQGAFAQRAAPLNFGFQNTSWGTIGMIAESQDLFTKSGATVNIHKFDSGKTTRDAMIAGRIDIGVIGATPFIVGAAKGELVAIGIALYGAKTLSIVGGTKSGIKTVGDLKGRKVGSQLGSATDFVFQNKILLKFGLAKSDVHVVNVTFQNHMAALAAGSIDAFAGVEPFPSIADVEKIGAVVIDYGDFDLQPIILAANRAVVEGKRDAVIAFLRGWLAGVKVFKEEPDRAVQIVLKHFKDQGFSVSDAVIKLMLSKLDVNPDFTPGLKKYLEEESSLLIQQKNIEAMPDWDKLLNRDLLQHATGGA